MREALTVLAVGVLARHSPSSWCRRRDRSMAGQLYVRFAGPIAGATAQRLSPCATSDTSRRAAAILEFSDSDP
jgi:hypothetical protein